jgi:hypothetical protein
MYIKLCVNQIFNRFVNFVCKKMRGFFYASNLFHYIIIAFFMHERFDFESYLFIWDNSYRRFFINLLILYQIVLRSFNRDNFFHIYWFSRLSKNQWIRKWMCDFDEIKSKWQRKTKIIWSKKNSRDKQRSRFSNKSRWIRKWKSINK